MGKIIDRTGQRFGRLTVTSFAETKKGTVYWNCICDCGVERSFCVDSLRSGSSKSCGCLNRELIRERNKTHGDTGLRLHNIWRGILTRTGNPNTNYYHLYGGRGIKICDEWRDYTVFRDWALSSGYSDELTIERIDVNGDYGPDNCCWATVLAQANNRRSSVLLEYNNKTQSLAQWCRELNLNYGTVRSRLARGWTVEKSLSTPTKSGFR